MPVELRPLTSAVGALQPGASGTKEFYFDETMPMVKTSDNVYRGRVDPTWANPDKGAFGGAGLSYLLKASLKKAGELGYPTALSFSAEFPGAPKENEEFEVKVEVVKKGRSFLFLRATLTDTPEMRKGKAAPTIHLFSQGMFASYSRQVDIFPPRALPSLSISPNFKKDVLVPILPLLGMEGFIKHFSAHAELKVSKSGFNDLARRMLKVHNDYLAASTEAEKEAILRDNWGLDVPEIWIAHKPDKALGGRRRKVDAISMSYWSDVFMTLAQSPLLPMDLAQTIPTLHKLAENPAYAHLPEIVKGLKAPNIEDVTPMNPTGEDGEGREDRNHRRGGMRGMADVGTGRYIRPSTSSLGLHWFPLPPTDNVTDEDEDFSTASAGKDEEDDFKEKAMVIKVQTTSQARDVSEREVQMFLKDGQGEYKLVCVARQVLVGTFLKGSVRL